MNGFSLFIEHIPIVSGIKLVIRTPQCLQKTCFLNACLRWISRLLLREMDRKFKIGGTIGFGDSYLWFLFRHFNVFRLHAILNDAAGAVWAHSGKGLGYCYMIGRGPSSCVLVHVTRLLFCLYVKLFLPSIFNAVDFLSSMFCILLENELPDKPLYRNWVFF